MSATWASARSARMALTDAARSVTGRRRVYECGRRQINAAADVVVRVNAEGSSGFGGLRFCGSVWSCPSCSGVVRSVRGVEVSDRASIWLKFGGGALFVTATVPHVLQDNLADSLPIVSEAWRSLWSGKGGEVTRQLIGYSGMVRSLEVTWGRAGWHPHIHALLLLDKPPSDDVVAAVQARLSARWAGQCVKRGWGAPSPVYGLRVDPVRRDIGALTSYVAKLQDGAVIARSGVGWELARFDRKRAYAKSVTPFEMLSRLVELDGDGSRSAGRQRGMYGRLFQEYEEALAGRSSVRKSRGMLSYKRYSATDEGIARDIQTASGGTILAAIDPPTWAAVCRAPGLRAQILDVAEVGGIGAGERVGRIARLALQAELDSLDAFWTNRSSLPLAPAEPMWWSLAQSAAANWSVAG